MPVNSASPDNSLRCNSAALVNSASPVIQPGLLIRRGATRPDNSAKAVTRRGATRPDDSDFAPAFSVSFFPWSLLLQFDSRKGGLSVGFKAFLSNI